MTTYNESSACRKCGSKYIGTQCTGHSMRRDCGRCGFVWHETPLDSAMTEETSAFLKAVRALANRGVM